MQKVTVQSPANIAFIKYWGQTKHNLYIPRNNNISMTLSGCITTTTLEKSTTLAEDRIEIKTEQGDYELLSKKTEKGKKAYEQIERIRNVSKSTDKVLIKSQNSFPSDAGIASSASGFSALTGVLLLAFNQKHLFEDKKELSRQVRLNGSASAARSVYGGYVELLAGNTHEEAYAIQLADENYWDLVDIIAVVNTDKKKSSSSVGHAVADTSPYFETRLLEMLPRIDQTKKAIINKNLTILGPLIEADCISMHTVMMTSKPPLFYWDPGTIAIIKDVIQMREKENIQAYFTIDAGANVHIICEKKNSEKVTMELKKNPFIISTIYNEPGEGTKQIDNHLF